MKIPFERTIAGAYRFAFTNILSIIGIGWFPFLVLIGIAGGLVYLVLPLLSGLWLEDQKTFDQARFLTAIVPIGSAFFALIVAGIVVQAMVTVGIMRKALGQHPGPVFIFFSLGTQVWELIGSYFLVFLLWSVCVTVLSTVVSVAGAVFKSNPQTPAIGFALGAAMFVGFLAFIYAAVRLMFFIPAVVVAENHIGLGRSWRLGRGNFWRIVGIWLVVTLPLAIAVSTISSTVIQLAAPELLTLAPPTAGADGVKYFMAVMHGLVHAAPYWALVQLAYFVLLSGLTAGAVATAYKAVTEEPKASA